MKKTTKTTKSTKAPKPFLNTKDVDDILEIVEMINRNGGCIMAVAHADDYETNDGHVKAKRVVYSMPGHHVCSAVAKFLGSDALPIFKTLLNLGVFDDDEDDNKKASKKKSK